MVDWSQIWLGLKINECQIQRFPNAACNLRKWKKTQMEDVKYSEVKALYFTLSYTSDLSWLSSINNRVLKNWIIAWQPKGLYPLTP